MIIIASIALAYNYFNQNSTDEKQYDSSNKTVNDSDVAGQVDDTFIEEDGEVEIGEMV